MGGERNTIAGRNPCECRAHQIRTRQKDVSMCGCIKMLTYEESASNLELNDHLEVNQISRTKCSVASSDDALQGPLEATTSILEP